MIDLSKLQPKVAVPVTIVICLCIVAIFWFSSNSSQPFMFYGQKFGGSAELEQRTKQLEQCQVDSQKDLSEAKEMLTTLVAENESLKKTNAELVATQQKFAAHESKVWFPVNDVSFLDDGTFETSDGKKSGKGKWSTDDGELSLKLVERNSSEIVLFTNRPEPENRIRMVWNQITTIPTNKWEYRLTVLDMGPYQNYTSVRIERRKGRDN